MILTKASWQALRALPRQRSEPEKLEPQAQTITRSALFGIVSKRKMVRSSSTKSYGTLERRDRGVRRVRAGLPRKCGLASDTGKEAW